MWAKIQETPRSCSGYRFRLGKVLLAQKSESLSFLNAMREESGDRFRSLL